MTMQLYNDILEQIGEECGFSLRPEILVGRLQQLRQQGERDEEEDGSNQS